MHAKAVHHNRQHRRQDKPARGGDVGVGHVFIACHHVVQIDHVATRHGQQPAEQIDLRRTATTPHSHAPHRA